MRRALRWIRNGLLALVGIVALLAGGVYVVSEMRMRRSFTADAAPIAVPQGAAVIGAWWWRVAAPTVTAKTWPA